MILLMIIISANYSSAYLMSENSDSEKLSDVICKEENLTSKYSNLFKDRKTFCVNAIDDDDFNKLCQNNGIDYKQFYEGNVKMLLMNNINS